VLASERARRLLRKRRLIGVASGVTCALVYLGKDPTIDLCGTAETCRLRVGVTIAVAFWVFFFVALYLIISKPAPLPRRRR